jgi:hypothetical protein
MKNKLTYLTIAVVLGLVSCGNDEENQTAEASSQPASASTARNITMADVIGVSSLAPGVYSVTIGADEHLKTGTYYQSITDEKLLIVNDDEQKAVVGFHALPKQGWTMVGSVDDQTTADVRQYEKIDDEIVEVSSFKGSYQAIFNNLDIDIQINQQGKIIAGNSACKLNGQIYEATLPNMVKYELTSENCEGLTNPLQGYLVKDINYEPASFRLINLNSNILDLWFYEN